MDPAAESPPGVTARDGVFRGTDTRGAAVAGGRLAVLPAIATLRSRDNFARLAGHRARASTKTITTAGFHFRPSHPRTDGLL